MIHLLDDTLTPNSPYNIHLYQESWSAGKSCAKRERVQVLHTRHPISNWDRRADRQIDGQTPDGSSENIIPPAGDNYFVQKEHIWEKYNFVHFI